MKTKDLEERMRRLEWFHSLSALEGVYIIIRMDGRSFTEATAKCEYKKPFDEDFARGMQGAAQQCLMELNGIYAYTESDEISLLLPVNANLFDRELEKLVSVSACIPAVWMSFEMKRRVQFDSRLWLGPSKKDVIDYFRWRQADALRCAINGYCYYSLIAEGKTGRQAGAELERRNFSWKNEFLFQRGINFNEVPMWQRRGAGVYWEEYEKEGSNPITKEMVTVGRRRTKIDVELPAGDEYDAFIQALIYTGL